MLGTDQYQRRWLDLRLEKKEINYLWDIINHRPNPGQSATIGFTELVGNISKSNWIYDKDNWFYETVLKKCAELIYYKDWNNYYNVQITKTVPPPVFKLKKLWVNYQKKHEFFPPHNHDGIFSFVIFMKIPTHWKEQHKDIRGGSVSDFQFLMGHGLDVQTVDVPLSSEDEGRMLFFPAGLHHQVFPFYRTEEERITISGNIINNVFSSPEMELALIEKDIKYMQEVREQLLVEMKDTKIN